jgi:hypothetical protein
MSKHKVSSNFVVPTYSPDKKLKNIYRNQPTTLFNVILLCTIQEWDQMQEQQKEIEGKLQELEASPPR